MHKFSLVGNSRNKEFFPQPNKNFDPESSFEDRNCGHLRVLRMRELLATHSNVVIVIMANTSAVR